MIVKNIHMDELKSFKPIQPVAPSILIGFAPVQLILMWLLKSLVLVLIPIGYLTSSSVHVLNRLVRSIFTTMFVTMKSYKSMNLTHFNG